MDYRKERFRRGLKKFEDSNHSVIAAAVLVCIVIVLSCVCIAQIKAKHDIDSYTDMNKDILTDMNTRDANSENLGNEDDNISDFENHELTASPKPEEVADETKDTESNSQANDSKGSKEDIPEGIRTIMAGISMPEGASVGYDDLSYLSIPYIDFSGRRQMGHMIVDKELADEVLEIFSELYEIGYPIERMDIIDNFNNRQTEELDSLDRASMGYNNTSAFCYRVVSGTDILSLHAYGRAIDLNPKINPYVSTDGTVSPRNAVKYADRSMDGWSDIEKKAFIDSNTEVYRIFTEHGWEWGGEIWAYKDYQHFQKPKN